MIKEYYSKIKTFASQMRRNDISAHSASTAFFFFLSIVPFVMVLCTMIPYTPLTEENLVRAVREITPSMISPLLESVIAQVYDKSAGILPIALIATIWSAGKGMLALMRGLNAVDGVEEQRNYFLVRLIASFYTIVMLFVVMISLVLMVFGDALLSVLTERIPSIQSVVSVLVNFRFMFIWLFLIVIFAAIYAYVPNKKQKFKAQMPGAIFTAVVWSVFSWGFSMYVELADYTIYGSLTLIVITMIWLYFCIYIMMIGAYINEYKESERE